MPLAFSLIQCSRHVPSKRPSDFDMPRLLGWQASKALHSVPHNPLRNSVSNPLRYPFQVRHLHDNQVPYLGPLSYATLTRRFSPDPDPVSFSARERANKAIERGQFVEIHDIGGVDPKD